MSILQTQTPNSLSQNFLDKISENPNVQEIINSINLAQKEKKVATSNACISNTYCVSLLDHLLVENPPNFGNKLQNGLDKKQHKKELENIFINKTEIALEVSNNFLSNKSWVNEKQWKMGKITRNLSKEWKDKYVKTINIWKEIEYIAKEENLIPVFFTGTVIGKLHPFSVKSTKRKKDWVIENLNKSYLELQDLHTQIRKQSKRTLGYTPHFFRAIEYHKSFVPHSHIVYFVEENDVKKFLKIIKNKEKLNKNIGRTETKVIDKYDPKNGKSPVSYLLKYLKKNIEEITKENDNGENLKIFNGWKNTLKIKQLYNNSIYKIPKWAFKKISWYYKNFEEMGYRSLLEAIENEVEIVQDSVQLDKTIKTKIINKPKNVKYKIYRKIEKYRYWSKEEELKTADRVLEFIIKNVNNEVIFNKNDYVFLEDSKLTKYKCLTKEEQLKQFQLKKLLVQEKFINFIKYDNIDFVNNISYKNNIIVKQPQKWEYDIFPFGVCL